MSGISKYQLTNTILIILIYSVLGILIWNAFCVGTLSNSFSLEPLAFNNLVYQSLLFDSELSSTTERYSTHRGWVTHICVGKLTIIGSDNGLLPGWRQAIIWTNAGILLIGPVGTNFTEILIKIYTFSFKKMCLKISSAKWRPCCLGLNVLSAHITEWLLVDIVSLFYASDWNSIFHIY